jgi:pseudouridine-5'-monophosphatase
MRGKPNPDVFLVAAREFLGRAVGDGEECTDSEKLERAKGLVFEDAIPGMQAGKRAGMSGMHHLGSTGEILTGSYAVVWVPDVNLLGVEYDGIEKADQILESIEDFVPEQWGLPPYV